MYRERTLTTITPCRLLPSGLWSSVPLVALPSLSLLGHGTFQFCCCLLHFRQSSPFGEEHEEGRDLSRKSSWLPMVPVIQHSSSTKGKSSRLPLIIHPSISLFTLHFLLPALGLSSSQSFHSSTKQQWKPAAYCKAAYTFLSPASQFQLSLLP